MTEPNPTMTLQDHFGQIDIYLFDQLLRGNITPAMRVLDAGCGFGRNLVYLLRAGCPITAIDANPEAIAHVRALAAELAPSLPAANIRVSTIEHLDVPTASADVIVCNSVLQFATDETHFLTMIEELWRALTPGGLFFCRLGSRIGMDFEPLRENIYRIPDGSEWFLPDEAMLLDITEQLDAVLDDPLKTTIVQDYRCMTTWVLRKRASRTS